MPRKERPPDARPPARVNPRVRPGVRSPHTWPSLQVGHRTAVRGLRRPSISTRTCPGPSAGRPAGCMLRLKLSLSFFLSVTAFSPPSCWRLHEIPLPCAVVKPALAATHRPHMVSWALWSGCPPLWVLLRCYCLDCSFVSWLQAQRSALKSLPGQHADGARPRAQQGKEDLPPRPAPTHSRLSNSRRRNRDTQSLLRRSLSMTDDAAQLMFHAGQQTCSRPTSCLMQHSDRHYAPVTGQPSSRVQTQTV